MRITRPAVLIGVAAAVLLSACTSDGEAGGSATPTPPTTSVPVSTSAPSTSASPTTLSTSAAPSTSASSSSSSASAAAAAPPFTTTCSSLSVRVLKGGAIRGAEIAAMQFVNDGTSTCTITGVPTAVLLRSGKVVGSQSLPNRDPVRPFTVRPGEYGEALLRDFSTCNAPLSDNLRLVTPTHNGTRGRTVTEPITLRACDLQVAPVGAPA